MTTQDEKPSDRCVVIFTIASVQEFVAAARRTQDAWAGSFLIAHLMKTALSQFPPASLLSPTASGHPLLSFSPEATYSPEEEERIRIASIPNVATIVLEENLDRAEARAAAAVLAVRSEAEQCVDAVRRYIERAVRALRCDDSSRTELLATIETDEKWSDVWYRQGRDWLQGDVYWAAAPIDSSYRSAARSAADALERRKLHREYRQYSAGGQPGEAGHRCTLCGVRAALGQRDGAPLKLQDLQCFWKRLAGVGREGYTADAPKLLGRLRQNDRLCAVCLTKRLVLEARLADQAWRIGNDLTGPRYLIDRHQFPSTAEIALGEWKRGALVMAGSDPDLRKALTDGAEGIRRAGDLLATAGDRPLTRGNPVPAVEAVKSASEIFAETEADWFLESAWVSDKAEAGAPPGLEQVKEAIKVAAAGLPDERRIATFRPAPTPYYALIAADGDHLGELLRAQGETSLKKFAEALLGFATEDVPRIVEAAPPDGGTGRVIYAGGDDLLAMVPVVTALHVMQALPSAYEGRMKGFGQLGSVPTLSAAAVVLHESQPLRPALVEVQQRLKRDAKDRGGRNAFSLAVEKRSGSPLEITLKWSLEAGAPLAQLQALEDGFAGSLSPGVIGDVRRSLSIFEGRWLDRTDVSAERLLTAEWKRLAKRHGATEGVVSSGTALMEHLANLRCNPGTCPAADEIEPWRLLLRALEIAHFLARGGRG